MILALILSLSPSPAVHQVNALDSLPSAEIVNYDFQLSFHHFSLLSLSVFVAFAQIKFDLSCLIAFLPVCACIVICLPGSPGAN